MEISNKLIEALQNRLKVGNRRGVHLNAITGNSRYKFDISKLTILNDSQPSDFIKALLSENPLKYTISFNSLNKELNDLFEDNQSQIVKIGRSFENLINQTEAIESEKGINTFGFGFPLLIRRDQSDNKLTVAPLLIWNLRAKHSSEPNTWEIFRNEDDAIYVNEVLINHLESDIKITIDQLNNDILEDGIISIDELANVCSNILNKIYPKKEGLKEFVRENLLEIKPIPDKPTLEKRTTEAGFHPLLYGGLFSIFEVQKQNIINEFDTLKEIQGLKINFDELEDHYFQPISSVDTDPSQQKILHSLQTDRNIVIQGPPGTGKSQTLTSILINALENDKKTIVVCEKRTALEVLEEALKKRGLGSNIILIKDIVSDRKKVVDSVRIRVDDSQYKSYRYKYSKDALNDLLFELKNSIDKINLGHKKIDKKILENKKWTDVVGLYLKNLKTSEIAENFNIESMEFDYSRDELNRILNSIEKGSSLFSKFKDYEEQILNTQKFIGENPFNIENNLNECFKDYYKQTDEIITLIKTLKEEYITNHKTIHDNNVYEALDILSRMNKILPVYTNNLDFYNKKKTQGFVYKISAIFSSKKKNLIINQIELERNLKEIADIFNSNYFKNIELTEDFELNCSLIKTFDSIIDNSKSSFVENNNIEFKKITLSDLNERINNLSSAECVKEKLTILLDRINTDSWVKINPDGTLYDILTAISSKNTKKNIEYH